MWRNHRTTLLLKVGKNPARPESYRPVTIGSLLSRIYWSIFDQKLRANIRFTPRQKGFLKEAGCFNDVHTLTEVMKLAKKKSGLVAVQLDISKAFDTVPHQAIEDALTKKGIRQYIAKLIRGSCKEVNTIISAGTTEVKVDIRRGVKQGDPLSIFIFNALMEPLILELEKQKRFQINEECKVSSLAFVDDIILLASDGEEARRLLNITEQYLGDLSIKISAQKCTAFQIHTTKDSWYIADPTLHTSEGDKIPYADANTYIKYLGGNISPRKSLTVEGLEKDFKETLRRVESLSLKPHQKAQLTSIYVIPQYIYILVLATVPATILKRLDEEMRRSIKDIFHLQQCTANGLI
jgi:hypothetical protein